MFTTQLARTWKNELFGWTLAVVPCAHGPCFLTTHPLALAAPLERVCLQVTNTYSPGYLHRPDLALLRWALQLLLIAASFSRRLGPLQHGCRMVTCSCSDESAQQHFCMLVHNDWDC